MQLDTLKIEVSLGIVQGPHCSLLLKWLNSREALGEWDEPSFPTAQQIKDTFRKGDFQNTWIIQIGQTPIGYVNFVRHPWDSWIACIGVVIAEPAFRNQGLGTKAHILLAEKIFASFTDIFKIEAFTDVENRAEIRSLEKAGFEKEGTQKRKNRLRGQFRDMHVFAKLRPKS